MDNIKQLDELLYVAKLIEVNDDNAKAIWNKIKQNKENLKEAIKIVRNKWNTGYLVNCITVASEILLEYENIDQTVYNELISYIYTNSDIARLGIRYNNGGSFLMQSLINHNLKLSDKQKAFTISEAMGDGVTIHRPNDAFGIKYLILKNPNWSIEEKQNLIVDFYSDKTFYDVIDEWEWHVVNDKENYKNNSLPPFDRYDLFNCWTYDMLSIYHNNKETTKRIWEEMEFCKLMRILRKQKKLKLTHINGE